MIIDLQRLNEQTLDFFWIDGANITIPMPSTRFANKVTRADNTFEVAYELALEFMNTNKEGRVFTLEDMQGLNQLQLKAILSAAIGLVGEVDSHPNL